VTLKDDLSSDVRAIFRSAWDERDGDKVPEPEDLGLGNDAVKLQATVLYADLADSTLLVDNYTRKFAAEIYKTFLLCAARIIRGEGGVITAYDGDRIMAVYLGDWKNTNAARTALKINWAVGNIINPAERAQYPNYPYDVKHVVGIDTSDVYVARTGIRRNNDLVWVGRAPNYAAKLATLPENYATYITQAVYDIMKDGSKFAGDGTNMWTPLVWTEFDRSRIYGSTFWWEVT